MSSAEEDIAQTMDLLGKLGLDMRGYLGGLSIEWRAGMPAGTQELRWWRLNPEPDAFDRRQEIVTTVTLTSKIVGGSA